MPITINGTGTVTGISAGGLPEGVITTDDIAAGAVTFGKLGTTEQGQLCKAWVNFNGTGTVAIRASYNVSSITDVGTGNYTVNFTTAFVDTSYAAVATVAQQIGVTDLAWSRVLPSSTTSCAVYYFAKDGVSVTSNIVFDPQTVQVVVFR